MKDNRAEVIEINSDDEAVFESDEEIGIIRRPTKRRLIQHPSEEDKSDETKTRKHTLNSTDSTTLRRRSMRSPINTTLMTPLKIHKTPMIEYDSSTSPIRKIPECAIKISKEPEKLMSPFKRLYSDKRAFEDSNQNQHNACVEGSRLYKKLKSKNEIDNEKGSNEIVTYGNESDKQNIPILSYPKETSPTSTKQNAEINDSSCVKEKSFIERLSERTSQAARRDLIKKYLNMNQDKIPKEEDTDNTLLFNSQNSGIKANTTRDEPSLSPLKDADKQQKKQQQQQQQKTSLKMTGDTLSSVNQEIIHLDMDDEKEKCKYRATSHESFTRSTHPIKTSPKTSSPIPIQVPLKSSSSPVKDIITVTLHDQMDDYKPEPIGNDEHLLMYPFDGKNSITLYERDYSRLDEGTYLNDTLIDIFPKIWANDYPSTNIHTFSSFFFTKLSGSAATAIQYDTVKRWTANINIFEKKFVVVPVAQNNHWFIILVVNPSLCIPNSKDTCEDGHKSKVLYAGEVLDREK
ncbi:uncharacterized protein BX663DRAFT_202863 [Cokeromyces recurvatus]|uniref:uncharacterized protein n=1 Tax=Cokeromyces recurvatus TaxID=90255 RepID=UPI002220DBAA|nr:uncharacterized protein BX663DRAFT_202863 [Cokeromyces recurvatus]KAI7906712.1 hypothetical protein BX663DRAFT_202863 [Cokeromyces recurvatus]